jgi:hypothetical protein
MTPPGPALTAVARRLLGGRQVNHLVRFDAVLELLPRTDHSARTLLDVGSGSRGLAPLLPAAWRVTSADADFEDYGASAAAGVTGPEQVLADVRQLPFEDRSFDFVVAIDLLEHVPPEGRDQAVRELCRVARRRAILAFPAGDEALAADRALAERIGARGRTVPPWLTEHLDNGFPEAREILAAAAPYGRTELRLNESLGAHVRLVRAELHPLSGVVLRLLCRPLEAMLGSARSLPRRIAGGALRGIRGWDRDPAYRAVVVVDMHAQLAGHNRA